MRTFTGLLFVIFTALPTFSFASAKVGDSFDFKVISACKGCVNFDELSVSSQFPVLEDGVASFVRFYYSDVKFENVTENSPYVETQIDINGSSISYVKLGNLVSGQRYYFKVGLATNEGKLIFFTSNESVKFEMHSIVVQ